MTVLDWAIVAFTIALALWGYRQGLIVGAMTLVGFGLGAFAGSRVAPMVLAEGARSPYTPLFAALGALLAGALVAVAVESFALGVRAKLIRRPVLHLADGAGGAALIASVALGLAWVFGAVALHAHGTARLRADVQESLILRSLNRVLPPSGPVLNVLDRVDPAPSVDEPAAPVPPPDPGIATDPEVLAAGGAVVRVLGTACGLGIEGSGWAVRPDLIVTNAHVLAGSSDTTVSTAGGAELDATAVYYDPSDDLALLRVNATMPTLPISERRDPGSRAAVLGYPENGPYGVVPARLGDTRATISEDSYRNGPVNRTIVALRGWVRSGNSGGPLVDSRGRAVGTVFAATTSGTRGGFAIPAEDVRDALAKTAASVSTGPCTD
ncbi:MAG TPA: MarP family serine protease [Solirubrobacterales bacterium]|jgi:S1-C subfamily serine protease|nr:MarP family serine protease [Solirubrobacterales bacterium]